MPVVSQSRVPTVRTVQEVQFLGEVFDAPVAVQRRVPMVQTVQISVVGPPLQSVDEVVGIPSWV